jgi:hypothetical protein
MQHIEFPPQNHRYACSPPPIVANNSADLFKQNHGEGASSSTMSVPVHRLDGDLTVAGFGSVPIYIHGVSEVISTIPTSSNLCMQ